MGRRFIRNCVAPMLIFSVAKRCSAVSRRCRILQYMLLLPACDSVQRPSASPRHILDTVWLRRHSEGVKLVSFFSPVVIPRLQKQRGERANQHSGLPRLSQDRDKSRERGVDRSTRGLTQNVSLAPDRRAVSHCRGRTLSGRRLLYPSERRTMCGPLFLTVAGICLLSVGTCLGFLTAALFATGAEPAQLVKAKMTAYTRRDRRIGLAGSRKPLHSCLLFARRGRFVWAHGRRNACAPPRCRSLSRGRMRVLRCPLPLLGRPTTW